MWAKVCGSNSIWLIELKFYYLELKKLHSAPSVLRREDKLFKCCSDDLIIFVKSDNIIDSFKERLTWYLIALKFEKATHFLSFEDEWDSSCSVLLGQNNMIQKIVAQNDNNECYS